MTKEQKYQETENKIPDGTTKGELMKLVFSENELSNVDASLPLAMVNVKDSFWMVMNYNNNALGELQDMRDILISNNN